MDLSGTWEGLRKQARKLEAQLDEQMNSYRRIVISKADGGDMELESTIERLIKQLQNINSQMQVWVSSGRSEVLSHTLTRHQEILQDLVQEFHRLQSSLRAKREHAELIQDFSGYDRSRADLDGSLSVDQALLREQATLSRTTGQMDNVIAQAQSTLGALVFQRSTFSGIGSKISDVGSRLPVVNQLLSSIKRKKSKDTIILSVVASVCTFLILIYWLSK